MFKTRLEGNERVVNFLSQGVKNNKLHHAYCFVGPDHVGKRTLVDDFVRALLCTGELPRPCGVCIACSQLNHADRIALDGEVEPLAVDSVREWLTALTLTSFGAGHRVGVMYHAHLMTLQTQQTLLKTLEEPPANAVVILTSHTPLLPTIMSRVQTLALRHSSKTMSRTPSESARHFAMLMQEGVTGELMAALGAPEASTVRSRAAALLESGQYVVREKLLSAGHTGSHYGMIVALDAMRVALRALLVNADPRLTLENFYYRVAA